jgi:hypothetical protein
MAFERGQLASSDCKIPKCVSSFPVAIFKLNQVHSAAAANPQPGACYFSLSASHFSIKRAAATRKVSYTLPRTSGVFAARP